MFNAIGNKIKVSSIPPQNGKIEERNELTKSNGTNNCV